MAEKGLPSFRVSELPSFRASEFPSFLDQSEFSQFLIWYVFEFPRLYIHVLIDYRQYIDFNFTVDSVLSNSVEDLE